MRRVILVRMRIRALADLLARRFDALEARWESPRAQHATGTLLSVTFLVAIALIELNRHGLFPEPARSLLTTNHLHAVDAAFTLLLLFEVISLVFKLPQSVSSSVGKQFEILTLILLRESLEEFSHLPEPIVWATALGSLGNMLAVAFGALGIFVILGLYYRVQKHRPITTDTHEQGSFIVLKKLVALCLFATLALIGLSHAFRAAHGAHGPAFFETFYTVLIFSDILLVLLSLRYAATYRVVFRNSGFAAATVLLRLALSAPPYAKAALGIAAAAFALGLTLAYNAFAPDLAHHDAVSSPPPPHV